MAQVRKGALRGIVGIEFFVWEADGLDGDITPDMENPFYFKYTQNATQEAQITEGEVISLTGSGKNVLTVRTDDTLDGYNVTFSNSLVDIETAHKLVGGTLKTTGVFPDDVVVGWNPPSDLSQVPSVYIRIYVRNYDSDNNAVGYLRMHLPFAKCGYPTLPEQTETDFLRFDFTAFASRNPNYVDELTTPTEYLGPVGYEYISDSAFPAQLL